MRCSKSPKLSGQYDSRIATRLATNFGVSLDSSWILPVEGNGHDMPKSQLLCEQVGGPPL